MLLFGVHAPLVAADVCQERLIYPQRKLVVYDFEVLQTLRGRPPYSNWAITRTSLLVKGGFY
jgi:hypothetical protein